MNPSPPLLADRMPYARTPSRRYRCAASSLTAFSLQARVHHEAWRFSVRKSSDEPQWQRQSTTVGLRLKSAAKLFKGWGPLLSQQRGTRRVDQRRRYQSPGLQRDDPGDRRSNGTRDVAGSSGMQALQALESTVSSDISELLRPYPIVVESLGRLVKR